MAAAVMVAAPALIVAGNGLHPVVDGQSASALLDVVAAGPARWLIAKLTYAAGSLLLIVALASVVRLRPGGVVLVGSVLAGIGTGCNALSQALVGYTAYAAVRVPVDRSAAAALLDGFDGLGPAALRPGTRPSSGLHRPTLPDRPTQQSPQTHREAGSGQDLDAERH
ncbi:hypothetical protein AB0M20_27435 [Actinoplanes sp. NPDC051633]|uniref:hypothetical protein n=1 Tax=Actinoplanes sp. NPDC051633 TaxID=3155670 RepID=UPI00344069F7